MCSRITLLMGKITHSKVLTAMIMHMLISQADNDIHAANPVRLTLLIFLISVAVGFGGSYLAFNFSKIYNGIFKSKTSETTSAYTAVDNEIYKVTKNGTPVFSKEDVNSTSVAILDKGDKVTVTAQGDKFSTVRLSNGMTGYIQNEKISLVE